MSTAIDSANSFVALRSRVRDYYELTKPEVNLLILMTTSAGFYLGSQGTFHTG
jgi:heme O synthase-like polyprenyltransferase